MSAPVYVVFMYSALCVQRCWMLVFLSTCSCRDIISSLAPRGWPSHEFDHKGCIIVEEEAQAGGDQREEDLRPAAQVQALLEAPGKKNTNCRGFQVFFLGKDEPTWKIQLITNLNPSSTKLTQKIKRNIAATKNHPKSPPKAPGWELPAMAHSPATSASRWSGRGHSWHRWVLLVAAAGSMDCGPNS